MSGRGGPGRGLRHRPSRDVRRESRRAARRLGAAPRGAFPARAAWRAARRLAGAAALAACVAACGPVPPHARVNHAFIRCVRSPDRVRVFRLEPGASARDSTLPPDYRDFSIASEGAPPPGWIPRARRAVIGSLVSARRPRQLDPAMTRRSAFMIEFRRGAEIAQVVCLPADRTADFYWNGWWLPFRTTPPRARRLASLLREAFPNDPIAQRVGPSGLVAPAGPR